MQLTEDDGFSEAMDNPGNLCRCLNKDSDPTFTNSDIEIWDKQVTSMY